MENITALDIVILVIIGLSTILAFARGFAREVLSLASWIIAAYGALFISPLILPWVGEYVAPQWLAMTLTYLGLFIAILLICSLIATRLSDSLKNSSVGPLDRTLGIIFGAIRGFVIVCLAYMLILLVLPEDDQPAWITSARLYPALQTGTAVIVATVPKDSWPIDRDKIDDAVSKGKSGLRDVTTDTISNELNRQLDGVLGNGNNNKTQDNATGKGYNQNDRAILDSLIRGTEAD